MMLDKDNLSRAKSADNLRGFINDFGVEWSVGVSVGGPDVIVLPPSKTLMAKTCSGAVWFRLPPREAGIS